MSKVPLAQKCASCGWFGLPSRLWCPGCSGTAWEEVPTEAGHVVALTSIRRAIAPDFDARPIVLVEASSANGSVWLIAVAHGVVRVGDIVECRRQGSAVVAMKR